MVQRALPIVMDGVAIGQVMAIAHEAGALLLRLQSTIVPSIKADGSMVTEADLQSNALILQRLRALTPHIPIVAEENSEAENLNVIRHGTTFWTVDPLDVTGNYAEGGDGFSVNIALIYEGVPSLGVLLFPAKEECYYTGDDGEAYVCLPDGTHERLHVSAFEKTLATMRPKDILSVALRQRGNEDAINTRQKSIRTIVTTGQHRACMVARGEALMSSEDAGFRIWDTAPTYAIIRAAGGEMRQNDGMALNFQDKLILPEYTVGHASLLDRILPSHLPEPIV
jgi:3'(2'), 5'-bisphosphate nucleotidase